MNDYEKILDRLIEILRDWNLRCLDFAKKSGFGFAGYLGRELKLNEASEEWKKGGDVPAVNDPKTMAFSKFEDLHTRTGKLFRSFRPSDKNTLTAYFINENEIEITFGSKLPYASIHETGGIIGDRMSITQGKTRGTKASAKFIYDTGNAIEYTKAKKGKPRTTGNMQSYFWAMYAKNKIDFYKIVALSLRKKGFITVKKRPYFQKAFDNYKVSGMVKNMNNFINGIINFIKTDKKEETI